MANTVSETTDATFEQDVLKSDQPVLVDFWATWCGPCKAMAPHLQTLAEEKGEALKVVKMDIQSNPDTSPSYNVSAVPTLLIFKGGQVVDQHVGAMNPHKLREFVDKHI